MAEAFSRNDETVEPLVFVAENPSGYWLRRTTCRKNCATVSLSTMSSNLLQNITSVATLLTAAAAFLTILEMRRHRIASYRPAIAIEDQVVNLYSLAKVESGRTIVFQPADERPLRETLPGIDVGLRVRNVGAG